VRAKRGGFFFQRRSAPRIWENMEEKKGKKWKSSEEIGLEIHCGV